MEGSSSTQVAYAYSGDWRSQILFGVRERLVNKILRTLKKHLQISDLDDTTELVKMAIRFEDKMYTTATNQTDYLRKISVKMLTIERNYPVVGN